MEENMQEENKNLPNEAVTVKLFLSRGCGFCRKLLEEFGDKLYFASDIQLIFYEDDSEYFLKQFSKAKKILEEKYPEIKNYEYITPLMLVINTNSNEAVEVFPGYAAISNVLNTLLKQKN